MFPFISFYESHRCKPKILITSCFVFISSSFPAFKVINCHENYKEKNKVITKFIDAYAKIDFQRYRLQLVMTKMGRNACKAFNIASK